MPPIIRREPSQSMALMPARKGVLGVAMSRKIRMITKARASQGTSHEVSMTLVMGKICLRLI